MSLFSRLSLFPKPSFDNIGTIGFAHDFSYLKGNTSPVMTTLDSLASAKPSLASKLIFLIGPMFPGLLSSFPNQTKARTREFAKAVETVAMEVLEREMAHMDEEAGEDLGQSIIGSVSE